MISPIQMQFVADLPFMNGVRNKCIVKVGPKEGRFFKKKVKGFNRVFVRSGECLRFKPSYFRISDRNRKSLARKMHARFENIESSHKKCRRRFRRARCTYILDKLAKASQEMESSIFLEEPKKKSNKAISTSQYATCKYPIELKGHQRLKKDIWGYKNNVKARPTKDPKLVCLSVSYLTPPAFYNKWIKADKLADLRKRLLAKTVIKHHTGWYTCTGRVDDDDRRCVRDFIKTYAGDIQCVKTARTKRARRACEQLIENLDDKKGTLYWLSVGEGIVNAVLGVVLIVGVVKLIKGLFRLLGRIGGGPKGPSSRGGGGDVRDFSNSRPASQGAESDATTNIVAKFVAGAQSYAMSSPVQSAARTTLPANLLTARAVMGLHNSWFVMPMTRIAMPKLRAMRFAPRVQIRVR